MTRNPSPREDFLDLVAAHEADDEDAIERMSERLRGLGDPLRLVVEEDTSWEESVVEGFSEFPVVTQSFKVFHGDDLVYEGERQFGSSLEDPTHTGLGGRWVTIRIDDEEHVLAERGSEDLGLEIEWPTAPPAR
jgi:hypothetical protein